MSYAPIFSEPSPHILNNSNTRRTNNYSFSKTNGQRKAPGGRSRRKKNPVGYSLLVHSHLCWNWVWQRPQQFVSRLSRKRKVIFVETIAPAPDLLGPVLRFRHPEEFPNITILTLQFPAWRWGDSAFVDIERRRSVKEFLSSPMA